MENGQRGINWLRSVTSALFVSLALAGAGCIAEVGPGDEGDDEGAIGSAAEELAQEAFPGQDGPLSWATMTMGEETIEVPFKTIAGYQVMGGDVILPGSPAVAQALADGAKATDAADLDAMDADGEAAPDDRLPAEDQAAAAAEQQADEQAQRQAYGVTYKGVRLWSGARMPYVVASNLSSKTRTALYAGMKLWSSRLGVRFIKRTKETSYIYVIPGSGSYSYLGRVGGKQQLMLASWSTAATAAHELGHAFGLHHEHQRADRDKYIKINWSNIRSSARTEFLLLSQKGLTGVNLTTYDKTSLMHYSSYISNFCVTTKKPVLTTRTGAAIKASTVPTVKDVQSLKALYKI